MNIKITDHFIDNKTGEDVTNIFGKYWTITRTT